MLSRSSAIDFTASLDPLSAVLQDLQLAGVSYGRCELTAPWGIDFPTQAAARFHFVASGESWLHTAAGGWVALEAGDVALLPRGVAHRMADEPQRTARPLADFPLVEIGERVYRLNGGGGGRRALLFCCSVGFDQPATHPLLDLMPPLLLVRDAATWDAALPALLEIMADEALAERVGAATVLTRLADVVIAKVVRAWTETRAGDVTGWLAALRDPGLGRALVAVHQCPSHRWSVEALADVAGASRSVFAERFTAVVGISPARYLTRWRMHLASRWLRHERLMVAEVAGRLGYRSEAAFSRAFKRVQGLPPSALRRRGPDGGGAIG